MRAHIESAETSADMWTILSKCANSANTTKGRQNLASKFRTIKANPGEPLNDYFGRLTEIRDLLKGTDHEIAEWVLRDQLLQNLPETYAVTKEIIENKEPNPSIHDIMETLKGKEMEIAKGTKSTNTSSTTETALYIAGSGTGNRGRGAYRGGYRGGRGRGRGNTFRSTPYGTHWQSTTGSNSRNMNCFTCDKPGHRAAQCPETRTQACFSCGDTTHRSTDCPHETLTQEQARRGRTAYSNYLDWNQRRNAKANLAEEPGSPAMAVPSL